MDEDGFDWHHADHQQWYMHEWDGDHLLSPFQCDMWWLRNIQPRNPLLYMGKDTLLLCCIHRADLAAMCGEGIIYGTHHLWRSLTSELTIGEVGHGSNAATIESLPGQRYIGISVALEMPMKLQEPGRHQSLCLIRSTVLSYYLVQVKSVSCNILS